MAEFNEKKPKMVTRYISSEFYFDFDTFQVTKNLYLKKKDKEDGEISVICIDNLFSIFDPKQEKIFSLGDSILFPNGGKYNIARADIKVSDLKKIKTDTEDILKLIHTKHRHFNIVSQPNTDTLFKHIIATKLVNISELKLRHNWSQMAKKNKENKIPHIKRA